MHWYSHLLMSEHKLRSRKPGYRNEDIWSGAPFESNVCWSQISSLLTEELVCPHLSEMIAHYWFAHFSLLRSLSLTIRKFHLCFPITISRKLSTISSQFSTKNTSSIRIHFLCILRCHSLFPRWLDNKMLNEVFKAVKQCILKKVVDLLHG